MELACEEMRLMVVEVDTIGEVRATRDSHISLFCTAVNISRLVIQLYIVRLVIYHPQQLNN